jgi:hypothetical protein
MELKANIAAFFDTFDGLIPCKVLKVSGSSIRPTSAVQVTFRITKTVKAWKENEILTRSSLSVCPKSSIVKRGPFLRIANYAVVES